MYYHAKTGGFYTPEVHGSRMPPEDELCEITREEYEALFAAQAAGKNIAATPEGRPVAVDRPGPSKEDLARDERLWRDEQLEITDDLVIRHRDELEIGDTTLSADQYREIQAWRRALREWPQSPEFPAQDRRPDAPAWLVSELDKETRRAWRR